MKHGDVVFWWPCFISGFILPTYTAYTCIHKFSKFGYLTGDGEEAGKQQEGPVESH